MLSGNSIREISHIFCGDQEGYYSYKAGSRLVNFFNDYFNAGDRYGQGFPSRWSYVYDKLMEFLNAGNIDKFLNIVLSREFLMRDCSLSQVEAAERIRMIYEEFNRIVQKDGCLITYSDGRYHLCKENQDLVLIGSGGFANVYKQKSTGKIVKKLKDDFLSDAGIRSRFKREYTITESLKDAYGIIKVYSFDESSCSYTMEEAEQTLEKYINGSDVTEEIRLNCIRQILYIMTEVHKRDIIHRDLSPNNIFIIQGRLVIADFGLGKDLKVFTSHQTLHTKAVGQYYYCAPEQFMMLKDGDKRSDVYSLGRIINFIMTGDPTNEHHIYRNIAEKSTNTDTAYRYSDAGELSKNFEKSVRFHQVAQNEEIIFEKMKQRLYDSDVEMFIYEMTAEKMSRYILEERVGMLESLMKFMECDEKHAQHIIQAVNQSYQSVCGHTYQAYDSFATLAYKVLCGSFPYVVKEIAASILRYIAYDVNRFSAQHLVDEIKRIGIEPLLEEILNS